MKHLFYILLVIPFLSFSQAPNLTTKVKLINEGSVDSVYTFLLSDIYTGSEGVNKIGDDFSLGYNALQYSGFFPDNILEKRHFKLSSNAGFYFEKTGASTTPVLELKSKTTDGVGLSIGNRDFNNPFLETFGSLKMVDGGTFFELRGSRNIEIAAPTTQQSALLPTTYIGNIIFDAARISNRPGTKSISFSVSGVDNSFSIGSNTRGLFLTDNSWKLNGVPNGAAYTNVLTIDPSSGEIRQSASSGLGGGTPPTTNAITNTNNTLTSTVNGIVATTSVVTTNNLERVGGGTPASSNFLRSTVNGVSSTDVPILNNTGLVYTHSTGDLSWGANGVVSSTNLSALKNSSIVGDTKYGYQNNDHSGWIKLDGRAINTLTSTQQTQATNLGITGNLPDTRNKFVKATNTSNTNLGQIGGSNIMQTTLVNNNIPLMSIALPDYSTNISTYNLSGGINIPTGGNPAGGTVSSVAITSTPNSPIVSVGNNFPTPITFTNDPINIALNHFIYLGN